MGTGPGPPGQPPPALPRWAVNADGLQAVGRRRPSRALAGALAARQPGPCGTLTPWIRAGG